MKLRLQKAASAAFFMLLTGVLFADVTVQITEPAAGSVLTPCTDVTLKAEVTVTAGETIKDVRFYFNDRLKYRDRSEPWEYVWKGINSGVYDFQAKVTTNDGVEFWSDPVHVKVGQISNGQILFNGNFDCGKKTNWLTQTASGTDAKATFEIYDDSWFDDQYYMFVEIQNGGTENWHVQMSTACPTDSGHVYEITFLADSDDPKTIDVAMQENQDPWASQADFTIDIDGPDLYGPYEVAASKTDPSNMLRFNVGNNTIPFYLDDVQVIDRSMSGVKAKRLDASGALTTAYELQQAFPNPFNMSTNLRYNLSKAADVEIDLFDMQGRKVRTLQNGFVAAGSHVARWNGQNDSGDIVSSGVYIARMSVNDASIPVTLARKLILIK